jgi:hypothetical protein
MGEDSVLIDCLVDLPEDPLKPEDVREVLGFRGEVWVGVIAGSKPNMADSVLSSTARKRRLNRGKLERRARDPSSSVKCAKSLRKRR